MKKKPVKKTNGATKIATGKPEFSDSTRRRGATAKIGDTCRSNPGEWVQTPWKVISGRSYVTIARAMSGLPFEGREDTSGSFWVRLEA